LICQHLKDAGDPVPRTTYDDGCPDCVAVGAADWVHLRLCLDCGYVGCCDSSPRRHMSKHQEIESHPLMRSFEPGETWRWCSVDELLG
jgi:Zn-finger in ubiquitin-hydrolases and other protein